MFGGGIRREQAIDRTVIRSGRWVTQERRDGCGRGWQPRQIERDAPQEPRGIFGRSGLQTRRDQLGSDEGIDGVARPVGRNAGWRRHHGASRGQERPVLLILGAFRDPTFEQSDFSRLEGFVRLGRRHDFIRVLRYDAFHQRTAFGPTWNNCGLVVTPLHGRKLKTVESQFRFARARIRPMAGETILSQDGLNVLVERQFAAVRWRRGYGCRTRAVPAWGQQRQNR